MTDAGAVMDQTPSGLDQIWARARLGMIGPPGLEPVPMVAEPLESIVCLLRIICGPAGRERFPVLGQRGGVERVEDQQVVLSRARRAEDHALAPDRQPWVVRHSGGAMRWPRPQASGVCWRMPASCLPVATSRRQYHAWPLTNRWRPRPHTGPYTCLLLGRPSPCTQGTGSCQLSDIVIGESCARDVIGVFVEARQPQGGCEAVVISGGTA